MFYGLPIHIMRDLFMTTRSFVKRLTAFIRYRRATQDMNAKYEDATVEDIQREDTCIICREEMRPWSVTNPHAPPAAPGDLPPARPAATANERSRPKKLPCGHTLHLGCLKSWLERQQVCPTCRRSVTDNGSQAGRAPGNNANPVVPGAPPAAPAQQNGPGAPPPPAGRGAGRGLRVLNLGPIRVGFGQANIQDMVNGFGGLQPGQENGVAGNARVYGLELGFPRRQQPQPQPQGQGANQPSPTSTQDHLQEIEDQIVAEIRSLQITQQELQLVQLLQVELSRLRLMQNGAAEPLGSGVQIPPLAAHWQPTPVTPQLQMQRHGARPNTPAIPAGSASLPPGVIIPEGWTLLPLQRLDSPASVIQTGTLPVGGPATAPIATTNPTGDTSNNTLTPTPTTNPEINSRFSSADSSDMNSIHTPTSIIADQSYAPNGPVQNATPAYGGTYNSTQELSGPPVSSTGVSPPIISGSDGTTLSGATSLRSDRDGSLMSRKLEHQSTTSNSAGAGRPSSTSDGIDDSHEKDAESLRRRMEKGKFKAVSVEDVEDEAGGS